MGLRPAEKICVRRDVAINAEILLSTKDLMALSVGTSLTVMAVLTVTQHNGSVYHYTKPGRL